MPRPLHLLILAAALLWHIASVGAAYSVAQDSPHARDFATYYYAAKVAVDGEDAYDRRALATAARAEHTRNRVYPFLYPPSFLLAVLPFTALSLKSAYLLWFWLGEVALALSAVALSRWLGRHDPDVAVGVVVAIALASCMPDNLLMGQANLLVLALTLCALWQQDRPLVAGPLLGLAIALKLSPVLVLGWWLLRGRWRAAGGATGMAVLALGASSLVFGVEPIIGFVTEVLPTLSDGSYNDLGLPVGLFGNHSVPNLWHQWLPSGSRTLGMGARIGASLTQLGLVGLFVGLSGPPSDGLARQAQVAALLVLGLLLPVFTYEHHLVWALPAVVLSVLAVARGRLHPFWAVPIGLAVAAWAVELSSLKAFATHRDTPDWLELVVRESKFGALLVLYAAMVLLGRGPWVRRRATARSHG